MPMSGWMRRIGGGRLASPLGVAVAEARPRRRLAMVREALRTRAGHAGLSAGGHGRATSRACAFHEGLVRILDDTGRIIPARDFMGAVETTELGRLIDCASLELGLDALAREPGLRLSVNMSARSIGYRALDRDAAARALGGPDGGRAADPGDHRKLGHADAGDRDHLHGRPAAPGHQSFALDDFGRAYTAFRYLQASSSSTS